MGGKIGRNDPCWCGSGKKYKKCHLNRSDDQPVNPWDVENSVRGAFSFRYCLAPDDWHKDCSPKIIRAHTIPRSSSLSRIARDGHVYAFVPSFNNLTKNHGRTRPQLVGIRQASTFTGFCSKHDDSIFAPIEKEMFSATPEQCFLLAYRAYAREVFNKRAQAQTLETLKDLDRGRPLSDQIAIQSFASMYAEGISAALRDLEQVKPMFDQALVNGHFHMVEAYVIDLELPPPVMCSGSFCPEQDFDGNDLQNLNDLTKVPHVLNVNSFFGGSGGVIVFSWLAEHAPTCRRFMDSFDRIADDAISNAAIRLMFEFIENLSIQPQWWDRLSEVQQTMLIERMASSASPATPRKQNCLADDGLAISPWTIRSRRWISTS